MKNKIQISGVTLLILGMLSMLPPFAIDMYLPAFIEIAQDLQVGTETIQKSLSVFAIGFALGQLIWGPIADSVGRKPVIILGLVIYSFSSFLLNHASNIDHFLWLRFIQGIFGAGPAVVVVALVRDSLGSDKNSFSKTLSVISLVGILAPLMAPFIGGYITTWFHWRGIFYVLTGFSFVAMLLVIFKIPETLAPENKQKFSLQSIFRRIYSLIRNKKVMGYIFSGAFSFGGIFAFITAGSAVYIGIYGVKTEHFGYFFILNILVMYAFNIFNNRFVTKIGSEKMLRFGLAFNILAACWLLIVLVLGLGFWYMAIGVSFYVGIISLIGSNSMAAVMDNYPSMAGIASSLIGTIRFSMASLVGYLVSLLPSNSAMPMLSTMIITSFLGGLCYYFGVYRLRHLK